MSFEVTKLVWDYGGDLSPPERFCLLSLADRANDQGQCFPSYEDIAERTGLGLRTVKRSIPKLIERGLLAVTKGGGKGNSNRYQISLAALMSGSKKVPERHPLESANGATVSPNGARESSTGARVAPEPIRTSKEPTPLPPKGGEDGFSDFRFFKIWETKHRIRKAENVPEAVKAAWHKIWDIWPRQIGKDASLLAFANACREAPAAEIIEAAQIFIKANAGKDPAMVTGLTRWLKDKRWTDEPDPAPSAPTEFDQNANDDVWINPIKAGKHYVSRLNPVSLALRLIERGKVTVEECEKCGFYFDRDTKKYLKTIQLRAAE